MSSGEFVDHEVEADVGGHAGDGGEDAAVEGRQAAFGLVHVCKEGPHAGEFFAAGALEGREGGGLDGEAGAYDVERVGEGDGGYAGEAAAEEALVGAEGGAGFAFEELGGVSCGVAVLWCGQIKGSFRGVGWRGTHLDSTHIAVSAAPR